MTQRRRKWNVNIAEARAIQLVGCKRVVAHDDFDRIRSVAGVDVGIISDHAQAAVAVLSFPDLTVIETAVARTAVEFPYVPGYLSFREVPAIIKALRKLNKQPDLILCDGQGYAHPRRFGLACHLGTLLNRPTIGVAKTRLIGTHKPVPQSKGYWRPLWDQEEIIGAVLRTRDKVKPVYVSIGHRISLTSAIAYTLACCTRYRLPETTRIADRLASNR